MIDPASTPTITLHSLTPTQLDCGATLVKQIRAYPNSLSSTEAGLDRAEVWKIANKYYSAWVKFKHSSHSDEILLDDESPAVIVVAPRTNVPSPELAAHLARFAAREPEFDVALLVSYAPPGDEPVTLDQDAWDDVGFEHGFEWVDVDPQADAGDEAETGQGLEEGGVGRVVAALHAHLWDNMVPAAKQSTQDDAAARTGATTRELTEDSYGFDESDEFASLGAPPLPEPRPFVPVPVIFPATMLPSLLRKSDAVENKSPHLSSARPAEPASPAAAPATAAPDATAFEDDFAPFVLTTGSFSPDDSVAPSTIVSHGFGGGQGGFELLDDDDLAELSRDGHSEEGSELEGGDDELNELVARLKGMREEARGLGLDERHALAERAVMGLLGE